MEVGTCGNAWLAFQPGATVLKRKGFFRAISDWRTCTNGGSAVQLSASLCRHALRRVQTLGF
jgi:hypothetical protein